MRGPVSEKTEVPPLSPQGQQRPVGCEENRPKASLRDGGRGPVGGTGAEPRDTLRGPRGWL